MAKQRAGRAAVLRSRDFLGRDVVDPSGGKLGSIRDLLLDRRSGTIRFLEVDLGVLKKNVIVPAEHIDWSREAFALRGWTADQMKRLPSYEADQPLTGEMLDELAWAYPSFYGGETPVAPPIGDGRSPVPISDARDFRIPKSQPDLRGWTVFGADGERVGKVDDLLVDPVAMKVAYVVVDVMDDLFLLKDDRHVLIPTAVIDLRDRGEDVWVRNLPAREIARLPAYASDMLDPLVLERVDDVFSGA